MNMQITNTRMTKDQWLESHKEILSHVLEQEYYLNLLTKSIVNVFPNFEAFYDSTSVYTVSNTWKRFLRRVPIVGSPIFQKIHTLILEEIRMV